MKNVDSKMSKLCQLSWLRKASPLLKCLNIVPGQQLQTLAAMIANSNRITTVKLNLVKAMKSQHKSFWKWWTRLIARSLGNVIRL